MACPAINLAQKVTVSSSICTCDYNTSIRNIKKKKQATLLGKAMLLERDSTLTIFTSKVIDVPSTFRNEDNEYVSRIPIDPGDRYRDTLASLKARRPVHEMGKRERARFMDRYIAEDNSKMKRASRSF